MTKRLFQLLLLVLLPFTALAQMSVNSFQMLERDLTANMPGTSRVSPQDGRTAALIKVVTTENDFNFDGGTYSLVGDPVYKPGEIWIYVPARAQKISISHSRFGMLRDYFYPIPIESARTYELKLDPGVGRFCTITTSTPRSTVYLDDQPIGEAPIYNHYILFGKHKLTAINGKIEGELSIELNRNEENQAVDFRIDMIDQSVHYGQVIITTEKDAEIVFNDEVKGYGSWQTEMREGTYNVTTRRPNYDDAKTTFTVVPQENNEVRASAPTPFQGTLEIFTRPKDVKIFLDSRLVETVERYPLLVGKHLLKVSRKGYYDADREYDIEKNVTTTDTINLERIQYVKKTAFYVGGSFVVGSAMGASGHIGCTLWNVDIEGYYMYGLSKSDEVNFYESTTGKFSSANQYTVSAYGGKIGYQIALASRFGITPQVGMMMQTASCKNLRGNGTPGDGAKCTSMSIGAKMLFAPSQHFCFFLTPEYAIPMSKDKKYEEIANAANIAQGGFYAYAGFYLYF